MKMIPDLNGVYLINDHSNIAIATLWTKPEYIINKLPNETLQKISVIGTLYSREGINYVIESLAKRFTWVDTLIVFGPDLTGSGDALIRAFNGECGEWVRVPCNVITKLGVKVIDLRSAWPNVNILVKTIEANYNPNPRPRSIIPIEVPRPPEPKGYDHPSGWALLYDTSLFYLWVKILDYILTYGYPKPTEYGDMELETSVVAELGVWGNIIKIDEKFAKYYDIKIFEDYKKEIMDPSPPPEGVAYTYGHRFRGHIYGDQLDAVIEKLSKAPYTRRAVMSTWAPGDMESTDPPCIIIIQFLVQGKWINASAYIRSNDMFRAWPANMYSIAYLTSLVAEKLSEKTGTKYEVGIVTTLSMSAHIYDRDIEPAKRVVEENWRAAYTRDAYDPRGNFAFNDDEAMHFRPNGILYRRFKVNRLIMRREVTKLNPDHAFYLAKNTQPKHS